MSSDGVDKFDVLNVWPSISKSSVEPADLAEELECDVSDVEPLVKELSNTDAVTNVGIGQYDLTGVGAILASAPEGGRFIDV